MWPRRWTRSGSPNAYGTRCAPYNRKGDHAMTRLFGTDGIRGVANEDLTPDLAFRLGRELVATLQAEHGADRMRLVIGRDTRRSGPLLEAALSAGALSSGTHCYAVGILPTPDIAEVTRRLDAHDGINISADAGALHPENLQKKIQASGASVGFAFDGDGDRLISVDHTGEIRDGDYALAIAGRHLAARQRLKQNLVVTTVMANLGLDQALEAAGIRVVKTQVGDRYVFEEMQRLGANLGGEQSGHLLFLDHAPAGDGILSALALLSVAGETGEPLASLSTCLSKFPQVLLNVSVRSKPPIDSIAGIAERKAAFEQEMAGRGRVLIRYSGTESLARVMIEGADAARIRAMADELAAVIRRQIGQ